MLRFTALALAVIGICVLATVFVTLATAAPKPFTPRDAARAAAGDYVAPLVRSDTGRVQIHVRYCRKRGTWHGCRLSVSGMTRCRGVLRVRVLPHSEYAAWMPRMRCR